MTLPNPKTMNLSNLVDVRVSISPLSAPRRGFDQMLILGTTNVITAEDRVALYQSTSAMLSDGFATTDPEYICAEIAFAQEPAPVTIIVGRQDLAASPPETALEALQACRAKNFDWYACIVLAAADADHKLIAAWAESALPTTVYFFTTQDADVLAGTTSPPNIGLYLNNLGYDRTGWIYSTTQSTSYPNNIYAAVAMAAYAMGQNHGLLANSAFTLMFKELTGISTEPLSETQVNFISGLGPDATGVSGNCYLNFGNYYNIVYKGNMASGTDFYETLGIDMLVNDIQLGVMDLLYGTPKVPQTDDGATAIINQINVACQLSVDRGFIAPGIWNGGTVLNLKNGDQLNKGFLVMAQPVQTMTQAMRDAGKLPQIYVAVKLAGAVKYVLIAVDVNR